MTGDSKKILTLKNILLDCKFETVKRFTTYLTIVHEQGYFYYENILTMSTENTPKWQFVPYHYGTMVNGNMLNGEINTKDDIMFVVPHIAEKLIVMNEETGFVERVNALIETYTYQYSEVTDGKYSIRFVGTSQLETEETIVMNVKATTASGLVKTFAVQSPGMEKLFPFDEHNINESIVAADIDVQKMLSVTVFDVPVGEAITFEFWITMTMPSGAEVTSTQSITVTFDATGAPVVAA
jgi:hypothetical protein